MRLLISSLLFVLLSACTSQMWQAPTYQEKIIGFYGAKEERLVIIEGQKYSYVFEATEQFIDVLIASRKMSFVPYYSDFKVDENNQVTGNFQLIARSIADKEKLEALGFLENRYDNMELNVSLKGKIYQLEGEFPLEKLENDHFVTVQTPESGLATVGKIIATPATVTIDAAMVIPATGIFTIVAILQQISP